VAATPATFDADAQDRAADARDRAEQDAERAYQRGARALDQRQWEAAAKAFADAAKTSSRADGALYWKAYAQSRLGQSADALTALAELQKAYAQSRWLNDAKALAIEIQQAEGKPVSPEAQADEELKLLAINGVMRSDPEKAVPILEKMLLGPGSPRLKERALFVLLQNGSPRAREAVMNVARGGSNPDLQQSAIRSLGVFGGEQSRDLLVELYPKATDARVKREILNALFIRGAADKIIAIARQETNSDLKKDAVSKLSLMKSKEATDYMLELLSK
jgi:hypothetical protein